MGKECFEVLSSGYVMAVAHTKLSGKVTCLISAQEQVSENFNMEWGGVSKVPPPVGELLVVDSKSIKSRLKKPC